MSDSITKREFINALESMTDVPDDAPIVFVFDTCDFDELTKENASKRIRMIHGKAHILVNTYGWCDGESCEDEE